MRKIRLFGQAALAAMVIATAGFTNAEAQSLWDKVRNPPSWVPRFQPHPELRTPPPLKRPLPRRPYSGIYKKPKHYPAGYFQQRCIASKAKARKAVNEVYTKHKQGQSHPDKGFERWYANELRKIAEAEQRCAQVRPGEPILKEAYAPR